MLRGPRNYSTGSGNQQQGCHPPPSPLLKFQASLHSVGCSPPTRDGIHFGLPWHLIMVRHDHWAMNFIVSDTTHVLFFSFNPFHLSSSPIFYNALKKFSLSWNMTESFYWEQNEKYIYSRENYHPWNLFLPSYKTQFSIGRIALEKCLLSWIWHNN